MIPYDPGLDRLPDPAYC